MKCGECLMEHTEVIELNPDGSCSCCAKQHRPQCGETIRFWRKRQGGWGHAVLVRLGRKWATILPLGAERRCRVPLGDIQKAA